jgi:hypothetical protein
VSDRIFDVSIAGLIVLGWVVGACVLWFVWFVVGSMLAVGYDIWISNRAFWLSYWAALAICSIPVLWSLSLLVFGNRRHT